MTFAAAQQKCADEGLLLPIPGSTGDVSTVNAGSGGHIWLGLSKASGSWIRRVFKT